MKLAHLRIACYLYNQFSDDDSKYLSLSQKHPILQLDDETQVIALLKWLRSWGCRQFKTDDEKISINSITKWYELNKEKLPSPTDGLADYDLTANEKPIIELFDALSQRQAAKKQRDGNEIDVHIGPVGAAKTLFALRPNLFSPWDTTIYNELDLEGNGSGYVVYLSKIQTELKGLRAALTKLGVAWNDLFKLLKKCHTSYPKLIDEYYWITITKRCDPSEIEKFIQE